MAKHRPNPNAYMSLGDHLEDLRRRIILAILGIVPIFVAALFIGRPASAFLIEPVRDALAAQDLAPHMQVVSATETFGNYLKISFVITILVGAPWILAQLWLFVAPGLYGNERRFAYVLAPFSSLLTFSSMVFLYYIILPVMLTFFIGFTASLPMPDVPTAPLPPGVTLPQVPLLEVDPVDPPPGSYWFNDDLKQLRIATPRDDGVAVLGTVMVADSAIDQQFRINEHIRFVLALALAFAVAFQMPVVVLLLGWAGIIEPDTLAKYRRYAVLVLAVVSALITPADPLSMILMAVPLYGLYELGLLMLRILPAHRVAAGFNPTADDDESSE